MALGRLGLPPPLLLLLLLLLWLWGPLPLLSLPVPESSVLAAPQNVRIDSYNFKHVLRWSPVQSFNGTVSYRVQCRVKSVEHWEDVNCTNTTKSECPFDTKLFYRSFLRVRAEQGELRSAWSEVGPFYAQKNTILGPPRAINVTSEGNSLLLSFLPPTDTSMDFEYVIYRLEKSANIHETNYSRNTHLKFKNLKERTEYCFRVQAVLKDKKGEISDSYCKETQTTDATQINSIIAIFGSIVFFIVVVFLCSLVIWKNKSRIKYLWQPPLRIPSHFVEDLQNAGMVMENEFQNGAEDDHWDTVSVISNTSLCQTRTNSSTNENQVDLSDVEEHG
ncbi:hypothetical protein JRQ81_020046 [Phrynocephalus forsythii]|uniref:Fibronectin type-III domain-containing protein n=1 Tax=Phrynocephalus forsythii TaxID=171643 RepID=A0A9Q0XQJ8_9SAUR|nr:hypothetical protein JRQ81_020046 [Phrynocephalus forsythii]